MVTLAALGSYSLVTNFSSWPWTLRAVHDSGQHRGFVIGATKSEAFTRVIALQRIGEVQGLRLLDAPPTTYAEKYRGNPVLEEDLPRVAASDHWYVPLTECNCWLELSFASDHLQRVVEVSYRGPTV